MLLVSKEIIVEARTASKASKATKSKQSKQSKPSKQRHKDSGGVAASSHGA